MKKLKHHLKPFIEILELNLLIPISFGFLLGMLFAIILFTLQKKDKKAELPPPDAKNNNKNWIFTNTQTITASQDNFIIGLQPSSSVETLLKNKDFLEKSMPNIIGKNVEVVIPQSYSHLTSWIKSGSVDAAFLSILPYGRDSVSNYTTPVLQFTRGDDNTRYYFGAIIANANSKFKYPQDICGAKIGFTDLDSSSGYVYPKLKILKYIKSVSNKQKCTFTELILGSHENVLIALNEGKIDIGAVFTRNDGKDGAWNSYSTKYSVKTLDITSQIPADGFFITKSSLGKREPITTNKIMAYFNSKSGKEYLQKFLGATGSVTPNINDFKNTLQEQQQFEEYNNWYVRHYLSEK